MYVARASHPNMVFPSLPPQDYGLYPGPPYSTRRVADLACENGRPRRPSSAPDQPAGVSLPKHRPFRSWASPPTIEVLGHQSPGNVAGQMCLARGVPANASNIANVAGPMRSANQTGSWSRDLRAPRRSRGIASPPLLAWLRLQTYEQCNFDHMSSLSEVADMPSHPREGPRAGCTNVPDSRLPT